ncbi:Hsp20/alpha crystallin family protein [Bacteroidota bacterium]
MIDNKESIDVQEKTSWEEALEKESWIAPLVDIIETDENHILIANMPGVDKENIRIKIEDDSLIIMGRIEYNQVTINKYVLKETEGGNYYRKFNISDSVDEGRIEAKFEGGQLILTLPKHERVKPKTISIN